MGMVGSPVQPPFVSPGKIIVAPQSIGLNFRIRHPPAIADGDLNFH